MKRKKTCSSHFTYPTVFDKIPYPFIIKVLRKLGIEETCLSVIKNICEKPTGNILNGGRLKDSLLRSRTRQGRPLSSPALWFPPPHFHPWPRDVAICPYISFYTHRDGCKKLSVRIWRNGSPQCCRKDCKM